MRSLGPSGENQLFEALPKSGIFVLYHGRGAPSQTDWDMFVNQVNDFNGDVRCLVYTEGWHPSRTQGQQISEAHQGRKPTIAVVSPSTAVAFVVSVFALVNRRMRFFNTDELPQAFAYLGLNADESRAVSEILERLGVR